MNKNNFVMIGIAVVVAVCAFYGGMKYQESKLMPASGNQMTGRGQGMERGTTMQGRMAGGQRMQNGMGMSGGEVTAVDETHVTVKLPDGSSKLINLASSTKYAKSAEGSVTDIKVGEQIAVFGTTDSDGSITAETIQLNPAMRMMVRPSGAPQPQN